MQSIGSLIPTIFYDLIARICPGILFFFIVVSDSRVQPFISKLPDETSVILLVVSGYVVGFLLDVVTQAGAYLFDGLLSYVAFNLTKRSIWALDVWEVIENMEDTGHSMRMRKYMAELSLFRVLSASWLILWILQVSFVSNLTFTLNFSLLIILLCACYCRDLIARRSAQRFIDSRRENNRKYRTGQFWVKKQLTDMQD